MNLPNKISLARICMIPVFMLLITPLPYWLINVWSVFKDANDFINGYGIYIAAGVFFLASVTDSIDGYLARKHNQITNLGIFLDPIADKLLVTASLIALCCRGLISSWIAVIIIGREFIVTGLRLVAAGEGKVISAARSGKLKMVIQITVLLITLIINSQGNLWVIICQWIMIAVTIYSGLDYFIKNRHILKGIK